MVLTVLTKMTENHQILVKFSGFPTFFGRQPNALAFGQYFTKFMVFLDIRARRPSPGPNNGKIPSKRVKIHQKGVHGCMGVRVHGCTGVRVHGATRARRIPCEKREGGRGNTAFSSRMAGKCEISPPGTAVFHDFPDACDLHARKGRAPPAAGGWVAYPSVKKP